MVLDLSLHCGDDDGEVGKCAVATSRAWWNALVKVKVVHAFSKVVVQDSDTFAGLSGRLSSQETTEGRAVASRTSGELSGTEPLAENDSSPSLHPPWSEEVTQDDVRWSAENVRAVPRIM